MSHYCLSNYQHIIPISIDEHIVDYIKYDSSNKNYNYPCWCEINSDHNKLQYILHSKTKWPQTLKILATYRPFNWMYNGNYHTMSYEDWLKSIHQISIQCDCCDNTFFD